MTLAATLMGGLLAVYQWEERKRTSFPWLAIAMFSLAALTKGPVAIALPGFIFVLLLLKHKESPFQILRSGLVLFAPVLFVVGLWYLAAFLERRDAFLDKVWYENVQRFLGTQEDEPHKNSVLYLWASLIIGLIPWSFILLGWCAAAWKGLGEVVRVPQSLVVRVRTWWSRLDPFERYSFLVLASFLLFFSIPGSKRSVYLLPAYPFAAFLLSGFFDARALTSLRAQRMLACTLSSTTLVLAGLIALVLNFPELVLSRLHGKSAAVDASFFIEAFSQYFISASVWEWGAVIALMLLAVGVLAASFPLGARLPVLGQKPFLALATLICALCAVGNWVLFPPAVNGLSSRDFADAVSAVASEEDTLYSFDTEFYGLSFYAKRPVYRYEERKPTTGLLLLNETDLPDFRGQVGGQILISPLLRSATPITRPRDYVLLVRLAPISTSGIGFGSH
jgi:4-amino-4-deoxy-L-arabinose transferase-like glycosyltransferase